MYKHVTLKRLAAALSVVGLVAGVLVQAALPAFANTTNLIANPGFETASGVNPASWISNTWGTNTAKFTYENTGRTGNRAASVAISGYQSGDARWSFTPVTVIPGATYTFSNWYKSTAASGLDAVVTTTTGATSYIWMANPAASAAWKQQTFTFTAPMNAKAVTFYHYLEKNGTLTVDDYSLTANSVTPPNPDPPTDPEPTGNLVANPSVETANGGSPAKWTSNSWGTNTRNFTYENNGQDGSRSLKATISAYTSGDAKWMFEPVAVTPGTAYNYSEWYKSNVATEVDAMVTMKDGSTQWLWLGTVAANSGGWQKLNLQFTAPSNAAKVTIVHVIAAVGYVQVDNVRLASNSPAQFNRGLVSLTFDDGWSNIYTNGFPILQKYGLLSTQYVNSQAIVGGYSGYMNYQMVKDFAAAGHELGWHTRSHADITSLSPSQLNTELTIPADFLSGIGKTAADFKNFASPYGAYNASSVAAVMNKYQSHRSTDVGFNSKTNFTVTNVKVQNIMGTTTPAEVKSWVDQAIATKTWLVIVYHEVADSPVDPTYSVTPANLDTTLNLIKQSGATVKTFDAALSEVKSQL